MKKIGVVPSNQKKISELFKSESIEIIPIHKETENKLLDGLIITTNTEESITEVIDWLLYAQKFPGMFVWIFLPKVVPDEQKIYYELGANGVFCIPNERSISEAYYVIKNTTKTIQTIEQSIKPTVTIQKTKKILAEDRDELFTKIERQLFTLLSNRLNITITYKELYETIWKKQNRTYQETDKYLIANAIFHLREKLTHTAYRIKTIRNKGYKLYLDEELN